jgi:N-acyl-D-amino-acid deacylase
MQQGMVADITIFDPEKVTDNATYKMGEQGKPTTGIPYVIVNGQMVVKDSEFRKAWSAGRPIRFPVEAKGRFVPISIEEWTNNFAIPTIDVQQSGAEPNIYLKR